MSRNQNTAAYMDARLDLGAASLYPIEGYPGRYAVRLGELTLHVTPEQWDALDTIVRAGIAVHEQWVAS